MHRLLRDVHAFEANAFGSPQPLFDKLSRGEAPEALFITCSDSRLAPRLVTECEPGDLFLLRNAANILPPVSAHVGGEVATVEYAVKTLGIRDIILCGHTRCGAVGALLNPERLKETPAMAKWLKFAERTTTALAKYPSLSDDARWDLAVLENVLVQMRHLRTYPGVAEAVAAGDLSLHAWVYDLEADEVHAFDPEEGQFLSLDPQPIANGLPLFRRLNNSKSEKTL